MNQFSKSIKNHFCEKHWGSTSNHSFPKQLEIEIVRQLRQIVTLSMRSNSASKGLFQRFPKKDYEKEWGKWSKRY